MSINKKYSVVAIVATAAVSAYSQADFLGYDADVTTVGDYTVLNVNAVFSSGSDVALNIYETEIGTLDNGGFNHSDTAFGSGGSWAFSSTVDIPGFADSTIDSYVTMGDGGAALDPGFGDGNGSGIPGGAGWYNGNPNNQQTGSAYGGGIEGISGYAVALGQFVFETARANSYIGDPFFSFAGEIGYSDDSGVAFGTGSITWTAVPAPGAMALFGLAGLSARRRRG